MPAETILIVEDSPESLKFTAGVLRGQGYKVQISSSAEQALSTLRFLQPQLVLVDFMLPGMNGLELTTRIKQDPRQQKTLVVALTGCSLPDDEARARQAGCDGYITKPIDAGALASRVRQYLDRRANSPVETVTAAPQDSVTGGIPGLPQDELVELQESFLKAGKNLSRQLLFSLDGQLEETKVARMVHQWIGTAGLLGYPVISYRARDVENVLRTPPWTIARLRGPVTNLARSFNNPTAGVAEPPSQPMARALQGKRVALVGLSADEADRICSALEQVGARARLFDAEEPPFAEAVSICHVAVVHVRLDNSGCRWLAPEVPGLPALPTVFLGAADNLLSLSPAVQARASSFLMEDCRQEEILMRLRLAVLPSASGSMPALTSGTTQVVIADRDEATRERAGSLLAGQGFHCHFAANGPDAILLLRETQPPVAVVDVDMDGFEVLAAIRAESLPVRAILVTTQPQEEDILRGFSLGAEDYLEKPYSITELAARLKRMLAV